MFQNGKMLRASLVSGFFIAAVLLFAGCGEKIQVADQSLGSLNQQSTEKAEESAVVSTVDNSVSGWSTVAKWVHSPFEEHFVNIIGQGNHSYAQCPSNIANGLECGTSGYFCQAGYAPTAAAYYCQRSYEIHGRVVDILSGAGIASATVIFHTGGPSNPWQGVSVTSDANGYFTYITGAQPGLAMALKDGYTNGYDMSDIYARAGVISGYKTIIPMRQALQ